MRASPWLPRAVGATVLVAALAIGFWPAGSVEAASGRASLPDQFATYSYLTRDVSASPPGRAIAVWQHGFGVELFDFPQAGLLGSDGDVYRRVDVAERRSGAESQGDPAPMLLSPDGTRIAVGTYARSAADLAVLDLTTGEDTSHPVEGGRSALPLAWSPDSSQVVYLTTANEVSPYSGSAISGALGVLNLEEGTAVPLPGPADARAAAFSPDGTELAIHRITPDDGSLSGWDGTPRRGGGVIDIVDLTGTTLRQIPLPDHHYLQGSQAWSPDGALLATAVDWIPPCDHLEADSMEWVECYNAYEGPEDRLVFFDASGNGGAVPDPLPVEAVGWQNMLGWANQTEVLLFLPEDPDNHDSDQYWITAVPLDGAEPRRLSAVPVGANYGVGGLQLATALLPDVEIRTAGSPDRGQWPGWLRIAAALGSAGVAFVVVKRVSGGDDGTIALVARFTDSSRWPDRT